MWSVAYRISTWGGWAGVRCNQLLSQESVQVGMEGEKKGEAAVLAPPDGGYGWVIVLAVLLQLMFAGPLMATFGIIFGPKFKEFDSSTAEQASIFAVYLVSWNAITMFVGPLTQLRSERFVALCSTTLLVGGLILCAFSTSTYDLVISYGIVVGCGFGLGNANAILILNKYFKKRVGAAFGLMATGLAIGAQVMPQLMRWLVEEMPGKKAILAYACLTSAGFIGALMMRDPKPLMRRLEGQELEEHQAMLAASPHQSPQRVEAEGRCGNFILVKVFRMMNWRLLRNPYFLMLAAGNAVVFVSSLTYLPQLRNICSDKGLNLAQTANVITILATTEMIGRPFWGFLGDSALLKRITSTPKKFLYTMAGLGCSVGFVALTFTSDFLSVAIVVPCISVCGSCMMVNSALIFAEAFGKDLPSALGLSNLFRGVIGLLIGPVMGKLRETTGSFTVPLFFLAACVAGSMLSWCLIGCLCRRGARQDAKPPILKKVPEENPDV